MAIQGWLEAVGEHDLWRFGESVNCQCCQHCQIVMCEKLSSVKNCQNCQAWQNCHHCQVCPDYQYCQQVERELMLQAISTAWSLTPRSSPSSTANNHHNHLNNQPSQFLLIISTIQVVPTTITIIATTKSHNLYSWSQPSKFFSQVFSTALEPEDAKGYTNCTKVHYKREKNIEKSDNIDQHNLMRTIVTCGGYCLVGQLWWVGGGRQGGHQCGHGVRPWWPWRWWWWW